MSTLEESLALTAMAPGEWHASADPNYEANTGMFGGWTAALLLKAVVEDARAQGTPVALTMNFLSRITPRTALTVRTRPLGATRSLATWASEVFPEGQREPTTIATIVLANRRESDTFLELKMPEAPDPDTLGVFHPPGTFGQRTMIRPVFGDPPYAQPSTRSVHWGREMSGRRIDRAQLAYLADCYAPRVFFISAGPRPSSTITMSVYFHASDAELAEVDNDYVLSDVTGTRAAQSTVGSKVSMWSRKGALLATSEQICWFK